MSGLAFTPEALIRRPPSGIDVETTLAHFAIVTYRVAPEALSRHLHPRFEPEVIETDHGPAALISVVPFLDQDFRFHRFPWLKWRFPQTNYRAYVRDRETGEHVVWFFGTSLGSWTVAIPRRLWRLPWHPADIRFDCRYDENRSRYGRYRMETTSRWADATLQLEDSGQPPRQLAGFSDLEAGLVLLTHPLAGYFFRSDGSLGSYSIWHDRLQTTVGRATEARFSLLDRLGLVPEGDLAPVHSVLMQHKTEFTIYLPPRAVEAGER